MDDSGILGGALNQLGQTVKQAAKQVAKVPEELVMDLGSQVKGEASKEKSAENQPQKKWQSDEERVGFLKGLYGSSRKTPDTSGDNFNNSPQNNSNDKKPTKFQEQIADKSPEEQKQLLQLRQDLHKQVYYDPTFNPMKKQEERPAEKVEKEKKIEMQELEQKEANKPPPIAVQREQNKAEQFRGVSG